MDVVMIADKIADHIRLASTGKLTLDEAEDNSTFVDQSVVQDEHTLDLQNESNYASQLNS